MLAVNIVVPVMVISKINKSRKKKYLGLEHMRLEHIFVVTAQPNAPCPLNSTLIEPK